MTINNKKLINRWNSVMNDVGCEHVTIGTELSELEVHKKYYETFDGISLNWMIREAKYWLSCYYEEGNVRCDDRFYDADSYKMWLSETGKLKRLISKMENMIGLDDVMIVEW